MGNNDNRKKLYEFYKNIQDAEIRVNQIKEAYRIKGNDFEYGAKLYGEAVAFYNGLRTALETLGWEKHYEEWERTRQDLPF